MKLQLKGGWFHRELWGPLVAGCREVNLWHVLVCFCHQSSRNYRPRPSLHSQAHICKILLLLRKTAALMDYYSWRKCSWPLRFGWFSATLFSSRPWTHTPNTRLKEFRENPKLSLCLINRNICCFLGLYLYLSVSRVVILILCGGRSGFYRLNFVSCF